MAKFKKLAMLCTALMMTASLATAVACKDPGDDSSSSAPVESSSVVDESSEEASSEESSEEVSSEEESSEEVSSEEESSEEVSSEEESSEEVSSEEESSEEVSSEEESSEEESSEEVSSEEVSSEEVSSEEVSSEEVSSEEESSEEVSSEEESSEEVSSEEESSEEVSSEEESSEEVSSEEVSSEEESSEEVSSEEVSSEEESSEDITSSEDVSSEESSEEESSEEEVVVEHITAAPVEGATYLLHMYQGNLAKDLYFAGSMSGYYYATTTDADASVELFVEYVDETNFYVYFMNGEAKKYLGVQKSGKFNNVKITDSPVSTFYWSDEYGTILVDLGSDTLFLGTYNTYNTFSASYVSYIAKGNFVGGLVKIADAPVVPPVVETKHYELVVDGAEVTANGAGVEVKFNAPKAGKYVIYALNSEITFDSALDTWERESSKVIEVAEAGEQTVYAFYGWTEEDSITDNYYVYYYEDIELTETQGTVEVLNNAPINVSFTVATPGDYVIVFDKAITVDYNPTQVYAFTTYEANEVVTLSASVIDLEYESTELSYEVKALEAVELGEEVTLYNGVLTKVNFTPAEVGKYVFTFSGPEGTSIYMGASADDYYNASGWEYTVESTDPVTLYVLWEDYMSEVKPLTGVVSITVEKKEISFVDAITLNTDSTEYSFGVQAGAEVAVTIEKAEYEEDNYVITYDASVLKLVVDGFEMNADFQGLPNGNAVVSSTSTIKFISIVDTDEEVTVGFSSAYNNVFEGPMASVVLPANVVVPAGATITVTMYSSNAYAPSFSVVEGLEIAVCGNAWVEGESYQTSNPRQPFTVAITNTTDAAVYTQVIFNAGTPSISLDAPAQVTMNMGGAQVTFKAPEDGIYFFVADYANLSESVLEMTAGEKVTITVAQNSPSPETTVAVSKATAVVAGDSTVAISAWAPTFVAFKAPVAGTYTFSSSNAGFYGYALNWGWLEPNFDEVITEKELAEGEIVIMAISSDDYSLTEANVSIARLIPDVVADVTADTINATLNGEENAANYTLNLAAGSYNIDLKPWNVEATSGDGSIDAPYVYERAINSITIDGAEAVINALTFTKGSVSYDPAGTFYFNANYVIGTLTIKNVTVSSRLYFNNLTIENLVFENVTFDFDGAAADGAIHIISETDSIGNVVVDSCSFVDTENVKKVIAIDVRCENSLNLTVKNSTFASAAANAMQISGTNAVYNGTFVIEANEISNTQDRAIRFSAIGATANVSIVNNVFVNAKDADGEVAKASSVAEGAVVTISGNAWGSTLTTTVVEGMIVSGAETIMDTAPVAPEYSAADYIEYGLANNANFASMEYVKLWPTDLAHYSNYTDEETGETTFQLAGKAGGALPLTINSDLLAAAVAAGYTHVSFSFYARTFHLWPSIGNGTETNVWEAKANGFQTKYDLTFALSKFLVDGVYTMQLKGANWKTDANLLVYDLSFSNPIADALANPDTNWANSEYISVYTFANYDEDRSSATEIKAYSSSENPSITLSADLVAAAIAQGYTHASIETKGSSIAWTNYCNGDVAIYAFNATTTAQDVDLTKFSNGITIKAAGGWGGRDLSITKLVFFNLAEKQAAAIQSGIASSATNWAAVENAAVWAPTVDGALINDGTNVQLKNVGSTPELIVTPALLAAAAAQGYTHLTITATATSNFNNWFRVENATGTVKQATSAQAKPNVAITFDLELASFANGDGTYTMYIGTGGWSANHLLTINTLKFSNPLADALKDANTNWASTTYKDFWIGTNLSFGDAMVKQSHTQANPTAAISVDGDLIAAAVKAGYNTVTISVQANWNHWFSVVNPNGGDALYKKSTAHTANEVTTVEIKLADLLNTTTGEYEFNMANAGWWGGCNWQINSLTFSTVEEEPVLPEDSSEEPVIPEESSDVESSEDVSSEDSSKEESSETPVVPEDSSEDVSSEDSSKEESSEEVHVHTLTHVEAVEAGCHYEGHIEYWVCSECEGVWQDEACTQLTNRKNVIVPELGGEVVHVEAKDATCVENGNIEYWYCESCEQVWQNEALTQLTNFKNVIVGATGEHAYVEGTCTNCGAVDESYVPAEPALVATFTMSPDGSVGAHKDSSKAPMSYTESNGGYTLQLTCNDKVYDNCIDKAGNGALKFGSKSAAGTITFTVADDVTKVVIYVAGYKSNVPPKAIINGTEYTIDAASLSDNGVYTAIEIDTSVVKEITFTHAKNGSSDLRCMVNTIEFWA